MRVFDRLTVARLIAALAALVAAEGAVALPIGFGTHQGDLEYDERLSDNFTVYHDRRVPGEGAMVLNALEAARPHMERWFDARRRRPLIVVMSGVTENASFANFITDAIELQTMGQGGRDLAWHEYAHSTMYRRLDNWFGPAGNIIHLPWMPAWFLEGLADGLSVTVNSDGLAGIERYQALSGDWPTYDRLHSLYSKAGFAERGYATSAALVRYLFRKGDPNKLPELLDRFYRTSMPWWWPYTIVPFADSLPMDRALEDFVGMNGEELYEAYKKDAKAFWESHGSGERLLAESGSKRAFPSVRGLRSDGRRITNVVAQDGGIVETVLTFDDGTGWASGWTKGERVVDDDAGHWRLTGPGLKAAVRYVKDGPEDVSVITVRREGLKPVELRRRGAVFGLARRGKTLVWLEQELDETRLCVAKASLDPKDVQCPVARTMPATLRYLGTEPSKVGQSGDAAGLWISEQVEHLTGTRYAVGRFDLASGELKRDFLVTPARPVSVAFAGPDAWVLLAERNDRTLRRYRGDGTCDKMLTFKDHVLDALGLADGGLVVSLYAGDDTYVKKIAKPLDKAVACRPEDRHVSPLLAAVASPTALDLKSALAASEIWTAPAPPSQVETEAVFKSAPLDQAVQPSTGTTAKSEPARWRGRPVFAFPWIGADDALGPQIGIVSVPLMDEMQNETVRLTFLYGVPSNFPYTEVALDSTRFTPGLSLAAYRSQTYNGRFIVVEDGEEVTKDSYLDEKGVRFEADLTTPVLGGTGSLGAGVKFAELRPYLGPEINGHGGLVEPAASFGLGHAAGRFNFYQSLSGRVAPAAVNENFDYNQVGASTKVGLALPFLESRTSLGLEGSRTRGKERRDLREVYRPLKTFIPGSGGGLNQNSYPLAGEGSGLFSPVFGDTQGRARADWTMPLIRDVDKMLWIIYLERLDFTAFYNYGAAWNGAEPRRGWERLIRAHGYNVDLQMENKGVRFNAGLGTGQVVGRDFEVYMTAGFDALF